MEKIIITGSSGLVATELIHLLLSRGQYSIYAVSTSPDKLAARYDGQENIRCLSMEEMEAVCHEEGRFLAIVHCAFARKEDGEAIASSLDYCRRVLDMAKGMELDAFINISSQSVYGNRRHPFYLEDAAADPDGLYGTGKYATELMVELALGDTGINYTNIRLASVCENARFMNVFVKNAMSGNPIRVTCGSQRCSFIDVRDVADALARVVESADSFKYAPVYNLGTGDNRSILELAEDVQRIAGECGFACEVERQEADISFEIGMDNSRFCKDFSWKPGHGYDDMVKSLMALNGFGADCPKMNNVVEND